MIEIEITPQTYREMTTDENELARAKQDGPLHIDASGAQFRVPYDGYVHEGLGIKFRLIGWPAKFKAPKTKAKPGIGTQPLPRGVEEFMATFLGKGYDFNFKDHPNKKPQTVARRAGLAVWLKSADGVDQLKRELNQRTNKGLGRLQALDDLLTFATAKDDEPEPEEEPKHERWSID